MYTIFMIVTVPALVIGWIAYAMWIRKVEEEEKQQPKKESERLVKTKSEISDWAQKMAAYKPPPRKKFFDEQPDAGKQGEPDKPK